MYEDRPVTVVRSTRIPLSFHILRKKILALFNTFRHMEDIIPDLPQLILFADNVKTKELMYSDITISGGLKMPGCMICINLTVTSRLALSSCMSRLG